MESKNSRLIEQALEVFDKCFPSAKVGTLATDSLPLSPDSCTIGLGKEAQMDEALYERFQSLMPISSRVVMEYTKCIVNGREFSTFSSTHRDSRIFYLSPETKELVPAIIRSIFVPVGARSGFYIAVHQHQEKQQHPILAEFPQFGASIWSQQLKDGVEILASSGLKIYGAFSRPWNSSSLIMKPAIEVSERKCSKIVHGVPPANDLDSSCDVGFRLETTFHMCFYIRKIRYSDPLSLKHLLVFSSYSNHLSPFHHSSSMLFSEYIIDKYHL
jgi:hypothetical protein